MALLVGLVVAACIGRAQARNDTIIHGWQAEPSGRGTWSIVWKCVVTVLLCTWSALHLEVPNWKAVYSYIQWWTCIAEPEHYYDWYV